MGFAVILIIGPFSHANTLYVPGDYLSVQEALDASGASDTVVVSPDTYTENIIFPPHAVTLTSTDPNNPTIVATTIIDGSIPADPNYGSTVTFNSAQGNDTILEGFTVTGGTGTWVAIAWRFHEVYWNRCGGGIVCYNMSQPTIRKNRIINNIAGEGGGIYVYGNPVNPSNPTNPPVHIQPIIDNNIFENNNAIQAHGFDPPDAVYTLENHGDGGAIVCFQGVDPSITNNTIQNNHADMYGGGLHLRQWSDGLIENNTIQNNDSTLGAGVHITYEALPVIRKNLIKGNVAGPAGGGGIYAYYFSNALIEFNTITENSCPNGSGIGAYWESDLIISNNLIFNNFDGSAIILKGDSTPTIYNNTITDNQIGGVYCITSFSGDLPLIENNIITSNGTGYGIYASNTAPTILYNNVWSNPGGNYGPLIGDQAGINGNVSTDPNFAGIGNYHLLPVSLCRDAGNPGTVVSPVAVDFDGEPRLVNSRIDMGADEIYFSPMDFNNDGFVDLADMAEFASEWLWTANWIE